MLVAPKQVKRRLLLTSDQTKGGVSRSVSLTTRARAILTKRLPWQFKAHSLRYFWDRAKSDMGLAGDNDFVLHACRHSCATRLVEAGVNLALIQRYLGHQTITTTLRYAHVSDELLDAAALSLESHLSESR